MGSDEYWSGAGGMYPLFDCTALDDSKFSTEDRIPDLLAVHMRAVDLSTVR
jgi:hypothetical protein